MVLQTDVDQPPKCPSATCMSSDVLKKSFQDHSSQKHIFRPFQVPVNSYFWTFPKKSISVLENSFSTASPTLPSSLDSSDITPFSKSPHINTHILSLTHTHTQEERKRKRERKKKITFKIRLGLIFFIPFKKVCSIILVPSSCAWRLVTFSDSLPMISLQIG